MSARLIELSRVLAASGYHVEPVNVTATSLLVVGVDEASARARLVSWLDERRPVSGWWWGETGAAVLGGRDVPDGLPHLAQWCDENGVSHEIRHQSGLTWIAASVSERKAAEIDASHLAQTSEAVAADSKSRTLVYRKYWAVADDGDARIERLVFQGFKQR